MSFLKRLFDHHSNEPSDPKEVAQAILDLKTLSGSTFKKTLIDFVNENYDYNPEIIETVRRAVDALEKIAQGNPASTVLSLYIKKLPHCLSTFISRAEEDTNSFKADLFRPSATKGYRELTRGAIQEQRDIITLFIEAGNKAVTLCDALGIQPIQFEVE